MFWLLQFVLVFVCFLFYLFIRLPLLCFFCFYSFPFYSSMRPDTGLCWCHAIWTLTFDLFRVWPKSHSTSETRVTFEKRKKIFKFYRPNQIIWLINVQALSILDPFIIPLKINIMKPIDDIDTPNHALLSFSLAR